MNRKIIADIIFITFNVYNYVTFDFERFHNRSENLNLYWKRERFLRFVKILRLYI